MTTLLSITPAPNAPVACDMRHAEDSIPARLSEYRRLFDHALVGRESTAAATTFRLRARPGVQDWVLDLARREAACCSFLTFEVAMQGDLISWTISGGLGASEMAVLDEFFSDPGAVGSSSAIAETLTQRTGVQVILPATAD